MQTLILPGIKARAVMLCFCDCYHACNDTNKQKDAFRHFSQRLKDLPHQVQKCFEKRYFSLRIQIWRDLLASKRQLQSPRCSANGGQHGQWHFRPEVTTWLGGFQPICSSINTWRDTSLEKENSKVSFPGCPICLATHYPFIHLSIFLYVC